MIYLRQSTASQEIPLGYFVDSTDGNTEMTALTIANTDIKLWKMGATTLANKNSGGATHISNGVYYAVLDATDTNTLGHMTIFVHVSGALTVRVETCVLSALVYDSLIAGTDNLQVDVIQAAGTAWASGAITSGVFASGAINRAALAADTGLQPIRSGTAQAGAAGTITLDASASATTDFYENCIIYLTGGTGAGQTRLCSAYNGSTKVATITPNWDVTPNSTSTFAVLPEGQVDIEMIGGAVLSTTTAQLGVNVVQISADATAADNLETAFDDTAGAVRWLGIIDQGTAQSATASTLVLRAAAAFANDELNGAVIVITGGSTGVGQCRMITDYVSASDTATIEPNWTTTPTGTITYRIYPSSFITTGDAAAIRAALGMAAADLDTQIDTLATAANLATVAGYIDTEIAGIKAVTDALPDAGALTSLATASALATVDSNVDAILVDTAEIGAAGAGLTALASQASVDDLPTNAELTTALGTADDAVLAQVALVKAKTDLIPAAPAAVSDIPTANANADALLDRANGVETGITLRQALRLKLAALAGKLSGAATTTVTIRDANDAKDRITATVDADGNRTAVTLDAT